MEEELTRIRYEVKNRLALITLSDPPDQFLSHALLGELESALDDAAGQMDLLALVLTSTPGCFSGGMDYRDHMTGELSFSVLERFRNILNILSNMSFPSLALVDGSCSNWACDLLHGFDVVISSDRSTFRYDDLQAGTFPPVGVFMLASRLGDKAALDLLLRQTPLSASEAQQMGMVSVVCPVDQATDTVKKHLALLASVSGSVLNVLLQSLRRPKMALVEQFMDATSADFLNGLPDLLDYVEGIQAWAEKRPPVWQNK